MLKTIQQFFESHIGTPAADTREQHREHGYQLATAALLIEMTRADYEVQSQERDAVTDAVRRAFDLSAQETEELVQLAESEADRATSLYEFTRLINTHFSPQEKIHLVELMWQVAFSDGDLDKYEEHLVRKVADLIYVSHRDFIRAKHRAQKRFGSA